MKQQFLLSGVATAVVGVLLAQSVSTVATASDKQGFEPNVEQKVTARQVSLLLDRAHYLDQSLDREMGKKILETYFDNLDASRTLLLQSDVDEFMAKYGDTYAERLKRGDLTAGIEIFERYRTRANEYYDTAKEMLAKDVDLRTNESIILDREEAPRFASKEEQLRYWQNQTTYALINITLNQEDDKAKDKAFIDNPELSRGQDLVKGEKRTPNEILLNRINRQQQQLARLKDDEIMEGVLNAAMMAYDPHSNYYAPVQANEMQIQSNLQLEGIGVSIRPDRKNPDYTRIISLVDGGPAQKQVRSVPMISS